MEHELKIEKVYFDKIVEGEKTCEVRLNDRDFQKWDVIKFLVIASHGTITDTFNRDHREWEITHVLNWPEWLKENYVVLSIKEL